MEFPENYPALEFGALVELGKSSLFVLGIFWLPAGEVQTDRTYDALKSALPHRPIFRFNPPATGSTVMFDQGRHKDRDLILNLAKVRKTLSRIGVPFHELPMKP